MENIGAILMKNDDISIIVILSAICISFYSFTGGERVGAMWRKTADRSLMWNVLLTKIFQLTLTAV